MPWKWSEAVPEGNGPVPQLEEFGSDEPTLEDAYRMIEELFNKSDRKLDELVEEMRATEQRLAGQEQDARQPRLTMEGGGPSDTKTRERTEGAAKAVQVMHEDRFSANEVDPDRCARPSEPPALSCRETSWSRMALQRQSRVSHPWRCAHQ